MQRPGLTIRGWMLAVAAAAMILVQAELGMVLVDLALVLAAVQTLRSRSAGPRAQRVARSFLVTLPCLYLPFAWVLGGSPGDSYRWTWITMWPVLPGLAAAFPIHPVDDRWELIVMASATAALLGLFTLLGSRGRRWLIASSILTAIGSAGLSWIAYEIFLW